MRSAEHDILVDKAKLWLANKLTRRGLCWATEVWIDGCRYVPDAIGLGCLQNRFAEQYTGGKYRELAFVFDAKISTSDYKYSQPSAGITIGDLHWIITPKHLFRAEDIADPWGLLEASVHGLREVKQPVYDDEFTDIYRIAYGILWANRHEGRRKRVKGIRARNKQLL